MFCFCLQSSLQKLQALEVEGGTSLGSSPEESPPPLGSKEQKSPRGRAELGGKEAKTLALCHGVPADENSPPGIHTPVSLCVFINCCFVCVCVIIGDDPDPVRRHTHTPSSLPAHEALAEITVHTLCVRACVSVHAAITNKLLWIYRNVCTKTSFLQSIVKNGACKT